MQVELSIVVLSVRDVSGNIHEAGAPTVEATPPRDVVCLCLFHVPRCEFKIL